MDKFIKNEKEEIEKFFSENKEHENKAIDFMLVNKEEEDIITIVSDGFSNSLEFSKNNGSHNEIPEWDFNYDYYLFERLEDGYEIESMSDSIHYSIWNSIEELYPEDINYKDGVQKYLQYCADNGITKEYLDKQTELDTPDIMKFFEGLAINETMEYKGYIIEADDLNFDNPKENLVHIYDNEQDYINGEERETVSLNTIRLKQNIKDYIDDVYVNEKSMESEKAYFTFVLGYDLLQDMIKKYDVLECDTNYDFCDYVANQFLDSEEYHNEKYSGYEKLQEWLSKNKDRIEKEYKETIGFEDKVYTGNLKILDTGFRKDEPIALVEKDVPIMSRKEYIVAFNYIIDEATNNLSWGYGYYYYDKNLGQKAYDKVINGGNLAVHNREER